MMSSSVQKAYKFLVLEVLFLIAFGGAVRAMNAGLACPDWPLCFGDFIPDYHPQVYFEFIHRVLAGVVAIAVFVLNIKVIKHPQIKKSIKFLAWLSFAIIIAQVIMGGLTVLLLLHAKVVTLHLALGTGLFACLLWIYMGISDKQEVGAAHRPEAGMKWFSYVMLALVYAQLLLGGLVASHYAALVCTEFPLCHGQWFPTFSGVIGLQVIHRLGAYIVTVAALGFALAVARSRVHANARRWSVLLLGLILVQVGLGIANVLLKTPPLLTVLHLAVGTMILGATLRVVYIFVTNSIPAANSKVHQVAKKGVPSGRPVAQDSSFQPG
ncbi:MAG: heme A synthase [Pseudobdellovibrionaceae bacterium]|nr:heme A synthase [Bdellovibrionales bacterium]USN46630.1 MAG: heme A synthase [Pseudobdellovibrionaceae bacterium]